MAAFQFLQQVPASSGITPAEAARIIDTNSEGEFGRLRGLPGFRFEPASWGEVEELARQNTAQSLGRLGRTPADLVVYARFKRQVLSEWHSMGDYMRWTVFGFDVGRAADGLKKTCPQPPDLPACLMKWRPNDFPYFLEQGMEHHNLWSTEPLDDERILQEVQTHRAGYETLWFRNPPALASIPAVWHIHVMSRVQAHTAGEQPVK